MHRELNPARGSTLAAIVLLLAWSGTASADEIPPKAARALEGAIESMKEGDLSTARARYERADKLTEKPVYEIKDGLSRILMVYGLYDKSLENARLALSLSENEQQRAVTLNRIGALLFAQGMPGGSAAGEGADSEAAAAVMDEAQAAVMESIQLSGGRFATPWYNLSEILFHKQAYLAAKEALASHLDLMPEDFVSRRAEKLQKCLDFHTAEQKVTPIETGRLDAEEIERVKRPEKISGPNPQYTEGARAHRVQGSIILESIISKEGDVLCVRPLKGLRMGLTGAAIDTVWQWKFSPALKDGEPVVAYYNLTVNFRLKF